MRLRRMTGDDPVAVLEGIRSALEGGPALGLGMLPGDDEAELADGRTLAVPEDTAAVIATSGSSGIPKRVILSADALRASALATAERIGSGRWVLALPAGYVAGLQVLVRSVLAGTDPIMLEGRFTPDSFTVATRRHSGDRDLYISLVPAQLSTLLDAADAPEVLAALRAYRAILVGGQALPSQVRERASDLGVAIVRTYGSSETGGGCVYDGIPLDGATVREVDGELRIAGRMLASGYLGDAALTEKTFITDADGVRWYRTGDHGTVEDGIVRVHGRIDNVIVSGGINVSLDRVEQVVRGVPGLEQAVVVGIDDERWGQASAIVVAGERGVDAAGLEAGRAGARDAAALLEVARELVADAIGRPARPVRLETVRELPLLTSGKPDREAVRRLIAEL